MEHKALLAAAINFEEWRHVVQGYEQVRWLRNETARLREADDRGTLDAARREKAAENLLDAQRNIAAARDIVAELITGYETDPFPGPDSKVRKAPLRRRLPRAIHHLARMYLTRRGRDYRRSLRRG
jgi:hypothetical protein